MVLLRRPSIYDGRNIGNPADSGIEKAYGTVRQRTRKLIGSTVLIVFVPVYALVVAAIAGPMLTGASILARTLFFLVTGLVWVLPAGALISWMSRGARPRT